MDDRTLTALKGSIKKWEGIVAGTTEDKGRDNCPLCHEFYDNDCEGCPVMEATGKLYCEGSPYDEYFDLSETEDLRKPEVITAARAELDFLRSLLPENAGQDTESGV